LHGRREVARHDADDHPRLFVEQDRSAEDVHVATEPSLPQPVADDRDAAPGAFFLTGEVASQGG
jgi:hypothetical protein